MLHRLSFLFATAALTIGCDIKSTLPASGSAGDATATGDGTASPLPGADATTSAVVPDGGATPADAQPLLSADGPIAPLPDGPIAPSPDAAIDRATLVLPDAAVDRFVFQFPDLGMKRDLPPPRDLATFESPGDLPVVSPAPDTVLLVPGRARLVGTHLTACTNGIPASGDRWCAFSMPNRKLGNTDLWVINVTKAMAGAAPKCDGTDANCKLMLPPGGNALDGTVLWTGQPQNGPIHPTTHRFDGDTLIFHAQTTIFDQYSGPIFAWRPGWDAPKQISMGTSAYSCSGHFASESFVCIENLSPMPPLTFDLTAGKLATGGKLVKRIVPARANMSSQWRATISRDGQYLAYSTGGLTIAERETLYVARFDTPDVSTMVRVGASRWSISPDGTKFYFLANYNYDTMGMPAGVMTMSDFPTGASEQALASGVGAIQGLAEGDIDRGIGFFDNVIAGKASYKVIKDRTMPSKVITVVTNIGGVLSVSRDQRFLYYYKDFNIDNGTTTDGYIVKMDGSMTSCALTTTLESDQFGAPFTRDGAMVLWADNLDQINGVGEGWVANPDGCTGRRKFADGLDFWFLRDNAGMLYSDDGTLDFSTLKHAVFPGGNTIASPTVVQRGVNRIYGLLPDFKGVVFNLVNSVPASDGLYLYTKLPF